MRKVALEATEYFVFTTRAFATGIPTALLGTPDISVIEDNSGTPIDTGATVATGHASVVGLNLATIICTAANGYEAGKQYSAYIDTGTVDSVSVVGEKIAEFQIETVAERAVRLLTETLYPASPVISTVTGNTTSRINLTDVVDAQTADADLVGSQWLVWDATNGQTVVVVVTTVESARLMNVETAAAGDAMDFTVAATDMVIFQGFNTVNRIASIETGSGLSSLQTPLPPTNVALSNIPFTMVDATDFATPETGLTVAGTRSIDGAAFGSVTGTIAEVGNGSYQLDASQADMNGGTIIFRFTSAGAADRFLVITTDAAF